MQPEFQPSLRVAHSWKKKTSSFLGLCNSRIRLKLG